MFVVVVVVVVLILKEWFVYLELFRLICMSKDFRWWINLFLCIGLWLNLFVMNKGECGEYDKDFLVCIYRYMLCIGLKILFLNIVILISCENGSVLDIFNFRIK